MDNRWGRGPARVLLLLGLLCLPALPAWSDTSDHAMKMPLAGQSLLLDIAAAGDRLVAVGERGHILHSDDAGANWVQADVPTSVMLTRVFFLDDQLGWAVGHDGNILLSRDGGESWELQRHGVTEQAQINEERAGRAKQQVGELQAQLAAAPEDETEDLQLALEEAEYQLKNAREALDEAVYAPPLMDVWFADENVGWASGAYGTLLRTGNGGRDWADWSYKANNADELHLNGVIGAPGGDLYLASEWGTVFRSRNGGENWEALETGYDGSFFGVLVSPSSGSVFAYGLLGTVYRSTDGGDSWEELESKARASLFGGHVNAQGQLVLVGQGGSATRSDDDGETFEVIAQPSRKGLHGVAPMGDGEYMVTGDGGSRPLTGGAQQ